MTIYPVVACPKCEYKQLVSTKVGKPKVAICAGCGNYFVVEVCLSPEITVYKLDRVLEET